MRIDAAANFFVIVDTNSSFVEVSTNNNITVGYNNVYDVITAAPTIPNFYILNSNVTINSVSFLKGSLISFDGVNGKLVYLFYNAPPIVYVSNKSNSYVKSESSTWSPTTTFPIVASSF
jgi:hypothetical protein